MFSSPTSAALWVCAAGLSSSAAHALSIPFKRTLNSKASDSTVAFNFGTVNDLETGTIYVGTVTVLGRDLEVR